jgi:predicted XRE-type DNA-binding protein
VKIEPFSTSATSATLGCLVLLLLVVLLLLHKEHAELVEVVAAHISDLRQIQVVDASIDVHLHFRQLLAERVARGPLPQLALLRKVTVTNTRVSDILQIFCKHFAEMCTLLCIPV